MDFWLNHISADIDWSKGPRPLAHVNLASKNECAAKEYIYVAYNDLVKAHGSNHPAMLIYLDNNVSLVARRRYLDIRRT